MYQRKVEFDHLQIELVNIQIRNYRKYPIEFINWKNLVPLLNGGTLKIHKLYLKV